MDLRGCKTTKQGPLGSLSAAHSISLGVFDEFSDSFSRQLGELGQKKGRSSIRLAPSPLSVPFGGKGLAPIHSRGPLAATLRRSSAGLLKRIRSIGRYILNASPPKEIHLLAVGGDHIFRVGDHPIEAAAARHYVRGCGL
jgi:hypothetical protein